MENNSFDNAKTNTENALSLIPSLCKQFYNLGWVTGTGGGISIKEGFKSTSHCREKIFIAPSGVQKERISPDDIFVQDIDGNDVRLPPPSKNLKKASVPHSSSAHIDTEKHTCCTILRFFVSECNAGAVIHTHSQAAVMATLLYPGREFRITHMEMIKGIKNAQLGRNYRFDEELVVPIIENTCWEEDLTESLAKAIEDYPQTTAVLVRRHGVYVWGDTWEKAKTQCECYDYLFEMAVKMKQFGIDPTAAPNDFCNGLKQ